jgi:hypothetical protein
MRDKNAVGHSDRLLEDGMLVPGAQYSVGTLDPGKPERSLSLGFTLELGQRPERLQKGFSEI